MFIGDLAILLNLLSIAVLAFIITVALIVVSSRFVFHQCNKLTFGVKKVVLWAINSAPWWVSASCVAFFWPREQDIFIFSWLNEFAHWHHIDIFNFTSWHAVTLGVALAFLVWLGGSTIYFRHRQSAALSDLLKISDIEPLKTKSGVEYLSLPAAIPIAFTTGFFYPKIYLTQGIQQQVSSQELDIIVQHELAHVTARDPLFKVIFAALASFYPSVIKQRMLEQYILLTEQMADNSVTKVYDNLDVAQTLINVARMQRNQASQLYGLGISQFGYDQTTIRVEHLINPVLSTPRLFIVVAGFLFAMMPLLTASTVDTFHHFIETFFTH